ncbi:hypothetical protein FB479_10856 [Brevibacillus sp. AG162]|uniref:DUF4200 domain-containing protein n=1 Tax=Brevibacillus sp. AG162 TaxID=2572910 RepID=UPI0011500124|nr:DUF4200 domain-containing protein [Brevibacillus sp. AG162]TQK53843.1 hypothetical protein FB479_10856 [Brevibacillus sp. AG162]
MSRRAEKKLREAREEMQQITKEAEKLTKAMGETSSEMQKMAKEYSEGMSRMQNDMQKLREETKKLGNMTVKPKVDMGEAMGKVLSIKGELASMGSFVIGVALGSSISGITDEAKAIAKERGNYVATGKTEAQADILEERAKKLTEINPYMKPSQLMAIIAKAEQSNPQDGVLYAEKIAKLALTTKLTPEDTLKMMEAITGSTQNKDISRTADAIQHMERYGGSSYNLKFLESLADFNTQNGNFIGSPDKMATTVEGMGKLLSDDKTFNALRKSTLNLAGQGELAKTLEAHYRSQNYDNPQARAAEEVKRIEQALSSGDKDAQNFALAKAMFYMAREKEDPQNKAAPNSDKVYLKNSAKDIAVGKSDHQFQDGMAQSAYESAVQANPHLQTMQAQATAKNAAMEAATKIASDWSTFTMMVADAATTLINTFNDMSSGSRTTLVAVTVFSGLALKALTAFLPMKELFSSWLESRADKKQQKEETDVGGSESTSDDKKSLNPKDANSKPETETKPSRWQRMKDRFRRNKKEADTDVGGKEGKPSRWQQLKERFRRNKKESNTDVGGNEEKPSLWQRMKGRFRKGKKASDTDVGGSSSTSDAIESDQSSLIPKNNDTDIGGENCSCDGKQNRSGKRESKRSYRINRQYKGKQLGSDNQNCVPDIPTTGKKPGLDSGGSKGAAGKNEGKSKTPDAAPSGNKPSPDSGGSTPTPTGNKPAPDIGGNQVEEGKAASKGGWKSMFKGGVRRIPLLGSLLGVKEIADSDNKLDTAAKVGAESLGGWGGAAAGAAAGAAIGSVLPGLGTAIGGIVGGFIGGMGGSFAGGALYDGVKSWWQDKPPSESATIQPTIQTGPPVPNYSPVSNLQEKLHPVAITIPQISIPLHVQGVLQDIPTMLKMLSDPSVAQRIKDIIERSLLDALETRGGVTT